MNLVGVGLDQVDQEHRVGPLDPCVAGVNLERQFWRALSSTSRHMMKSSKSFHLLGGKLGPGAPERLAARPGATSSKRKVRL